LPPAAERVLMPRSLRAFAMARIVCPAASGGRGLPAFSARIIPILASMVGPANVRSARGPGKIRRARGDRLSSG
jgi:hypothetical protein